MNQQIEQLKQKNLIKCKIIVWNNEQQSKTAIADRLGLHRQEMKRILEKFNEHGSMKQDMEKSIIENKQQLEDAILETWEKLSEVTIRNSIDSMSKKLQIIIDANGQLVK